MRANSVIWGLFPVCLFACAEEGTSDALVEDATFMSALSEGDGEALTDVPSGDESLAAEEAASDSQANEARVSSDCSLSALRQNVIDTYDIDGDGELSEEERAELAQDFGQAPRRWKRFARHHRFKRLAWVYDADQSGDLSDAERQELRNDLEQRCLNRKAQLLANFDADQDGTLSEAEWQAARDAAVARAQARYDEVLVAYDTNQDGDLDPLERRAFVTDRRTDIMQRRQDIRVEYDADNSGDLDAEELEALREAIKARVRGEHFGRQP